MNQYKYHVIDVVLSELFKSMDKRDALGINYKTVTFKRQEWFFTKEFFITCAAGEENTQLLKFQ